MKIALLSDIHGNSVALDAVLTDIDARGPVDGYWVLGDLVALGHDPVGVLDRLVALPGVAFVRGNTDRYVVTGDRPPPTMADAAADPVLLPTLMEIAGTFAWTQGALAATSWLPWLRALPLELRRTLPDGTRFLGVHARPGHDDGAGITADLTDDELVEIVSACAADLICVGHTHRALDRHAGRQRVVNLGSISNPPPGHLHASYMLLEAGVEGYQLTHRLVEYDRVVVIDTLQALGHPGAAWIIRQLQG